MKSLYKNKLSHILLAFFFFSSLNILTGCNKSNAETQDNNQVTTQATEDSNQSGENNQTQKAVKNESAFSWLKLSGWHTQGTVSRDATIRITFNREVIDSTLIGKDASKVMYISPSITGKPIFKSQSEIIWKPEERLQAGTDYKVSIKPTDFKEVPKDVTPFQFSFHVIPLEYEVKTFGLTPQSDSTNKMQLKGRILVSDRVISENIEKVLSASSQGKALTIEWNHDRSGKKHSFIISNIIRESFTSDITLKWNGAPINIKTKGHQEIHVPALNNFTITNIEVIHSASSNPYVQVHFSDDLDTIQPIRGLVQLTKTKHKIRLDGSIINIYPNKNLSGSYKVRINKGIKSKTGKVLSKDMQKEVVFDDMKPQVRFVGNGSILPENSILEIPFEAVGVNAVEVTAFEIYPDNMGQFLQVNRLSGDNQTERTGRYLWRKTIPLTPANANKWNRYSFNVTDMMKKHHGGLLRLTLSIKRRHSTYSCPADTPPAETKPTLLKNTEDNNTKEPSGWDGISDYVEETNYYDYDWDKRNDPCSDSYFTFYSDNGDESKTKISQNFIATNIGLIVKQDAKGNLKIISTDLRTAEPLTGVEFEVRNFQGQTLGTAKSDGSGFANIELSKTPFLLIAKKFDDTAYLKLNAKTALSISQFNVSGQKIKKGIKGIIYGERGVWRPGDDIFLTFVMQDKSGKLPEKHPVTMKLIDPQGRVVDTKTSVDSVGGFYAFKFKTNEKAETGRWMAKAFLGGSNFSKTLMIETVRPNRLKIELQFDTEVDAQTKKAVLYGDDGDISGTLFSQWLHGATASGLKADIAVRFSKKRTKFGRFSDYVFDDPSRNLSSQESKILEGRLDAKGYLKFKKNIQPEGKAAGMLAAHFTSRVFEKGGAFSISSQKIDYHPYSNYVGIKLPKGDATRGMLLTDKTHTVKIASLTAKGENTSLNSVKVSLYKIGWKWWWDSSADSLAQYIDGEHRNELLSSTIKTTNGEGSWDFEIKYPAWGRYLVRACDTKGGHCSAKVVFIDWPGWAGRAQEEGSGAASRLNLFSDKEVYTVGETAIIQIPAATQGRALLTIETGSSILDQRWIDLASATPVKQATASDAGATTKAQSKIQVEVPITAAMSPNAYVHVSLLQPHKDKKNDRPIRLYGIIPLEVADPATYLKPIIKVAEEWKPESKQKITVSESSGKAMNYTLAIVDEGLLGLTAFKTPNLHRYFYSKEALGIKTWDLFDDVIGAYGGKLDRMLALGGGEEAEVDNEDSKKRRFPPVVKFMGPFHLEAGKTAEHEVILPPYLGAVRVMLVAGEKGAYGKANESVFVRQALMLQASMPRVVGSGEEVSVPVAIFAMDESIKDVKISVKTNDLMSVIGDPKTQVSFTQTGEKVGFITLKANNREGKAHIHFTAIATTAKGEQKSEADIYLNVRRANQETSRTISKVIEPDSSWENKLKAFGLEGSNQSVLEVSSVPSLNLEKRLNYLLRYPHGCLEQTTSSVFPQLFLSNIMSLDKKKLQKIEHHINKGIERLQRFKLASGDFSYWPGNDGHNNAWASIYAGQFLIEAKNKGYLVPQELLTDWLDYQRDEAQNYVVGSKQYSHTQAYRLFVLALAGRPQLGAMNRLRENSKLNEKARWLLASAYQKAAQPDAAKALIQGLLTDVKPVEEVDRTFSSTLGDLGLRLESLVTLNKKQDANKLLEQIATEMGGDKYQNTQGIAWALMAVSRYLGGDTSHFSAVLTQDGTLTEINSDKPISSINIAKADANISVKNTSGVKLFATLVTHGIPVAGDEQSIAKSLKLEVDYDVRDKEDSKVWNSMENQSLLQGSDIRIKVSITNTSNRKAENIALTIPVAAGMEIASTTEQTLTKAKYDYRDIRDDRVHYYFSLKKDATKVFYLLANASYKGRYYLPAINVEAMYDGKIKARQKGQWINIKSEGESASESKADTESTGSSDNNPENSINHSIIGKQVAIKSLRAWLYDKADETTRGTMYLIVGDKVKILKTAKSDDNSQWLFIHFEGKKVLEKWIRKETIE